MACGYPERCNHEGCPSRDRQRRWIDRTPKRRQDRSVRFARHQGPAPRGVSAARSNGELLDGPDRRPHVRRRRADPVVDAIVGRLANLGYRPRAGHDPQHVR